MKEYNIYELIDALKSGELTIDFGNHTFNSRNVDDVIDVLNYSCISLYEDKNDDGLFDRDKNYKYSFENISKMGDPVPIGLYAVAPEFFCWGCGHRHKLVFIDESTLGFQSSRYHDDDGNKLPLGKRIVSTEPCSFSVKDNTDTFKEHINIPSGKVLVANWVSSKKDNDDHYDLIYSPKGFGIQSYKEQFDLMKHLVKEHNVFYGQTGNTSGDVFSNGKSIIMADGYYYSNDKEEILKQYDSETVESEWDETDEYGWELAYSPDGYDNVGHVSMDVWRYMICDYQQALDNNYGISNEHVIVDVEPGEYEVVHSMIRTGDHDVYFKMNKL